MSVFRNLFSVSPDDVARDLGKLVTRMQAIGESRRVRSESQVASNSSSAAQDGEEGKEGKNNEFKLTEKETKALDTALSNAMLILYGRGQDTDKPQEKNPKRQKNLATLLIDKNLVFLVLKCFEQLSFDAKRDFSQVLEYLLEKEPAQTVPYVGEHLEILELLVAGYESSDPESGMVVNSDRMLRACVRHNELCEHFLFNKQFVDKFFALIEEPNFAVSGAVFNTFRFIMSPQNAVGVAYINENFDYFFAKFTVLCKSENLIIKTECFEILGALFKSCSLSTAHFNIMMTYINDPAHLILSMMTLGEKNHNLQLAVFSVLKMFIANPKKSAEVESILAQNGDALLGFIHKFHKDTDNERMLKEKAELITTLEALSTAFKNPNSSPSIPSATADSKRRAADDNSNDATQTQADTPPATGVETMSPSTSSSSSNDAAAVDADAATASAPTEEDNSEANQHTLEPHKHMGQVDNVF